MGLSNRTSESWCLGGFTTLRAYDDDQVYMLVRADTDDPELQREVALVGAWDVEGERYARMIAAVPKLLVACQAVVERWQRGDLAEAARMCSEAVDAAIRGEPCQSTTNQHRVALETEKHQTRIIRLPCFGIEIRLVRQDSPKNSGEGTITSDLRDTGDAIEVRRYNAAIDALESLILAHACAGVDVESPAYVEGIETAVEAIGNHV
jgi:hypothetical protein